MKFPVESSRNSSGDFFFQEFPRRFPPKTPSGFSPGISHGISYSTSVEDLVLAIFCRNSFKYFFRRFPPGSFLEIYNRNFSVIFSWNSSGDFLQECPRGFPSGMPPEISSNNFSEIFLQEIIREFPSGIPLVLHKFLRGFLPRTPLNVFTPIVSGVEDFL